MVNAYVLTFAGFLLLGGRAADLYGRRRVYLFGLALFSVASLVGGFAQNSAWLTAARAVQGIGGAFLSPATLTIIVTTFSGTAAGQGARSVERDGRGRRRGRGRPRRRAHGGAVSWRWVLFVNVPIGRGHAARRARFLTEARRRRRPADGWTWSARSGRRAGLAVLVYAIVNTDEYPWGSARTLVTLGHRRGPARRVPPDRS